VAATRIRETTGTAVAMRTQATRLRRRPRVAANAWAAGAAGDGERSGLGGRGWRRGRGLGETVPQP
jgi:hypothetical protein